MYAVGGEHPLKLPSIRILELAARSEHFFTNAEVLQELLHRFMALRRREQARMFVEDAFTALQDRIHEVRAEDIRAAGALALMHGNLQARDLVHLAIMNRVGCRRVVSADKAFDAIDGTERLDPLLVDEWAPLVIDT
ncbi:MAG TPA: type II toxin-antitoxin system VapC family toxin [Dehalococcoidia bacterium]|nr:type II toxin-antitoxin system VapC family toxin [Dehalococcoidia bacterium]